MDQLPQQSRKVALQTPHVGGWGCWEPGSKEELTGTRGTVSALRSRTGCRSRGCGEDGVGGGTH